MTTMEACLDAVCEVFGCSRAALRSRRRSVNWTRRRYLAMYVMVQKTSRSYKQIGHFFERDYTTVQRAERLAHECLQQDEGYRLDYRKVLALLEPDDD